MPFEIQPFNYLWSKINSTAISEVTFWFVDDEDREVDLNDIDISLTVVIKTKKWKLKEEKEILTQGKWLLRRLGPSARLLVRDLVM